MARLEVNGLSELSLSLEEMASIPEEVLDEMLNAQADVIADAQKKKARAYGVYKTGGVIASIRKGKIKRLRDGKSIMVSFQGSRQRGNISTREAEIAFINEFGKRNQPARPFIRDANESAADGAIQASETVYDNWLKSKNL